MSNLTLELGVITLNVDDWGGSDCINDEGNGLILPLFPLFCAKMQHKKGYKTKA
jgi:hypothetical protein|tara:strand:- start:277 stop:438 length:162 start_codon:yes stop_codon:yes gene_type:complete